MSEHKFAKYEPVTVIDPSSPFYLWSGPVEHTDVFGQPNFYTVRASYRGLGLYGSLYLTFQTEQLQSGMPTEERQ